MPRKKKVVEEVKQEKPKLTPQQQKRENERLRGVEAQKKCEEYNEAHNFQNHGPLMVNIGGHKQLVEVSVDKFNEYNKTMKKMLSKVTGHQAGRHNQKAKLKAKREAEKLAQQPVAEKEVDDE